MTTTTTPAEGEKTTTERIEKIAAEFDIWRDGEESDAEFADRTIAALEEEMGKLANSIDELRLLFAECP